MDTDNATETAERFCSIVANNAEAQTVRVEKKGASHWYCIIVASMVTAAAAGLAIPSVQIIDDTYNTTPGIRWGQSLVSAFEDDKQKSVDAFAILCETNARRNLAQVYITTAAGTA